MVAREVYELLQRPRLSATVTVPKEPGVSAIESIDFDALPTDDHLQVSGVENGSESTIFTLENKKGVSDVLDRIRSELDVLRRNL
jgi:hypothetical protein